MHLKDLFQFTKRVYSCRADKVLHLHTLLSLPLLIKGKFSFF